MIWFHSAAYAFAKEHDRTKDHDGPRHYEVGVGLFVAKLLRVTMSARGKDSAMQMADKIEQAVTAWRRDTPDDSR